MTVTDLIKLLGQYPPDAEVTIGRYGSSTAEAIEGIAAAYIGKKTFVTLCASPDGLRATSSSCRPRSTDRDPQSS